MSDLAYLYGFVPADAPAPAEVGGIAGRPVVLLDAGPVRAVVSHVPAEVYGSEPIEPRLQDLSWVAEQGAAHETVVAWFVDHAEILPVSLFTLYSSDDALRLAVAPRAAGIAMQLAALRGRREWDVKIAIDEVAAEKHAAALSPRIAELEREAAAATPGRRYLIERKRNELLKEETRRAANVLAGEVFDEVRRHAAADRIMPLPRVSADLPVILHGALLVERDREGELVGALEGARQRLEARGLTLSFSGPWAAYRFAGEHERATDTR